MFKVSTQPQPRLTPDQYLELERRASIKSEYFRGEMFAMSAASYRHNLIAANIIGELGSRLRGQDCTPLGSDMRVATSPAALYTYPDVVIVCGPPRFLDQQFDTLLNPAAIFEILSPSTQDYDRGSKFELYRTIPSLRDYILIAQDRVHLEHFSREPNGNWLLQESNQLDSSLTIPTLDLSLPLAEIYRRVAFDS